MRAARPLLAAIALLGTAGCTEDFLPPSYLTDLRVLALVADPLELAPLQSVTIKPSIYVPPGKSVDPLSVRWTFCPLTAGSVAAYACAVPQCEVDLPFAADGTVTANPTQLIAACLGSGGGVPSQIPDMVETLFRYRVSTVEGQSRDAVLQIPQWTRGPPPDPNLPPVILGVDIGGVPAIVGVPTPPLVANGVLPVRLLIDPASVQTYVDAAGVTRVETMTGYFFSDGGRFSANLTTGVDTTVNLEGTDLVAGQASIQVWVLALDLRGGQALTGPFTVPVQQ